MHVYIAGPDVFRHDAHDWAERVRNLLAQRGHLALIPLDGKETTAAGIFQANLEMIRSADVVLANLNPFRGQEPDSGTAFEVGLAIALGKPVIGYVSDGRAQKEKIGHDDPDQPLDADGRHIENFGLPLNLMLAIPCRIVVGDLSAAIDQLSFLNP